MSNHKAIDFSRMLTASGAPSIFSDAFAAYLDKIDQLAPFRAKFKHPTKKAVGGTSTKNAEESCVYLAGNSLGLMPLNIPALIQQELEVWGNKGVLGHFDHEYNRPWMHIENIVLKTFANLVGAKQAEVACMNTLTSNIHTLLSSFYKPIKTRYKIMFEKKAFPSDVYAFTSQVEMHGYDPSDALLPIAPRTGDFTLRTEDILQAIKDHGSTISIVLFSGVQYYTGQHFEMEPITKAAQSQGCLVGWDLAHAVGNVPLKLHDWNVDFAAWCTYKYLNSGPGAIAGIFVHEQHANPSSRSRLSGWWGHNVKTRFDMPADFDPIWGAAGFQMSNPCVLAVISVYGALQITQEALNGDGFTRLRTKSELLTAYLEKLLCSTDQYIKPDQVANYDGLPAFTIITPSQTAQRGCQLSLLFVPSQKEVMETVAQFLSEFGIIGDERKPDVLRLSPVPLYNTFEDVRQASMGVYQAVAALRRNWSGV